MERSYILHLKDGAKIVTESDAILNAEEQEKEGVQPRYAFFDYESNKPLTLPGWLVWSTYADGCGVVYRRHDGKMVLTTGMQGDFCII